MSKRASCGDSNPSTVGVARKAGRVGFGFRPSPTVRLRLHPWPSPWLDQTSDACTTFPRVPSKLRTLAPGEPLGGDCQGTLQHVQASLRDGRRVLVVWVTPQNVQLFRFQNLDRRNPPKVIDVKLFARPWTAPTPILENGMIGTFEGLAQAVPYDLQLLRINILRSKLTTSKTLET